MNTLFQLRPATPNIGNDLIVLATQAMLRDVYGGHTNVATLPTLPCGGIKEYGLTAKSIHQINRLADGLLIGPGNLFENGSLHVEPAALSALQVPTVLFSVSHGRIYDRSLRLRQRTDSLSAEVTKAVCRRADRILVRDQATRSHLESLEIEDVRVAGCPTLFLDEARLPLPDPDPSIVGSVLLSIRHPKLMNVPYRLHGRVYYEVQRVIDELRARGERVQILCHDYQDLPFAQAYGDVPWLYTEDPLRFLSWLRDCRLSVTFRLHAFLPCQSLGVPSIHVSYDERASSLIETVGFGSWDINLILSENFLGELRQRLDTLATLDDLRKQTRPVWMELRQTLREGLSVFAEPGHSAISQPLRLAA